MVDSDLNTLSRVYLALVHRNYKAEASDKIDEIAERIKRLKPALLILGQKEYLFFHEKLKLPCIVLWGKDDIKSISVPEDVFIIRKPVQLEPLIHKIEEMVY